MESPPPQPPKPMHELLLESCTRHGRDHGSAAFASLDTCGPGSSVRNCAAGEALYVGVILTSLGIPVTESVEASKELRDGLRSVLMVEPGPGYATDGLMFRSMKATLKEFFTKLKGDTREKKLANMWTGKSFMLDIMPGGVGTHIYRDPALEILRKSWGSGGLPLTETEGWDGVKFPIVFHVQWSNELSPSGKVKMLFHVTFDPWRTAVALGMMLCSPNPPIQVRETPYKNANSIHQYQSPRKYIIDWDLYVEENLGKAAPMASLTEPFLFDLFVRSLAVIHVYMRRAGVLPGNRRLCMSIKSRTRRAKNKAGRMDTKCSYHATVHIMEPAERHRTVITKVLDMVRRDKISAYKAMTEKDGLRRGIESPGRLVELGDYAGFMAMDTAMTNNWHQPVQAIGSSKGDGIVFKHRALVVFNNNVDSAATGAVSINPSMDYEVFEAPPDDEQASYPDQFPLRMAMLIAQHSASMPDPYSITYTPTSKWNERLFGPPVRQCDAGVNALLSVGLGGKGGKKRKWGGDTPTSYCSSPAVSGCSTVVMNGGGGSTALALEAVPKWVMDGFINALHRVSMGSETFSACNFRSMDLRGTPELVRIKEYEGTSFTMTRSPCIVSACMDGMITIHKKNTSYIWIAKTARVAHSVHREELVYMKCMDPECQSRVKEEKKKKGDLARAFDAYGWALLDRRNMGVITGAG